MHDSRKAKNGSPASLAGGPVRRPPPGRGGLPGAVAATGLALLLSACGGGGKGAGALNGGAALGASLLSTQAGAAVAPAPVAKQAAPVARNTLPGNGEPPPPNPQPGTPNAPPGEEETPPPVDETTPPQTEGPPAPTDGNIVTDPSTIPFPSGSRVKDETIDINTLHIWGLPDYQPGGASAHKNNGPRVVVRRRVGHWAKPLTLPVSGGSGVFAYDSLHYGTIGIANMWLTYPADAGNGDLAVHIRTRKSSHENRSWVLSWFRAAAKFGPHYGFTVEDFFLTEAYLQAPGSGVQPAAQGSETSATWTGQVIAVESAANRILTRGTEIGGDAEVTVNFGDSPTVDVSLTDLRSARAVSGAPGASEPEGGFPPARYPSQTWTGLALAGGAFSDTSGKRSIKGAFRSQGPSTGTNANTVGGIFNVKGTMKGGFVANIVPPGPN